MSWPLAAAPPAGMAPAAVGGGARRIRGVRRRLELRGGARRHASTTTSRTTPPRSGATSTALPPGVGAARILAVLEPRSNTMKLGVHQRPSGGELAGADRVWLYQPADLDWNLDAVSPGASVRRPRSRAICRGWSMPLACELQAGDRVLIMSNGGFGGLHERLLQALRAERS